MAKVYVSSTFVDLQECRERVSKVLRQTGHEDVAMEYYVAGSERPVDKCLRDVAACDVYLGIFAWRYGWVPPDNNPDQRSVTEMEYREAVRTGKHCLIFLLHEDAPWPRKFMDRDPERIEQLRSELSQKHLCSFFNSAQDIAGIVGPAIYKWAEEHGYIPAAGLIPELDLDLYFSVLRKRYQRIDLEGLTPPQREEYLQLHLRSVFVEQSVRENPPPVELSKDLWERLRRDKEIHSDDLPEGVILDELMKAREVYYEKPLRPVLDVLTDSRYPHVVILGDPGSGKSTLSRYVLLSLIDAVGDEKLRRAFEGYLPLLIELRSYIGLCAEHKCDTFLEYLEYLGQVEGWRLKASALEHYLKNYGNAVVLFDGLDEIFDPEQREQILRRIVGFANNFPKARIIATSRVIGYRRKVLTDADFAHFTLQDLDESQVATFADHWYELALSDRPEDAKERCERILRAFKESHSIRQLAGNPMLLTIMAIIGKHQELPRERWKLYDHAANVLIEHWDINKHLRDHNVPAEFIGQDEKKEMLRRLAYRMQSGASGLAGNYIHRDDLQEEFESYLKQRFDQPPDRRTAIARAMIQKFRERNFILSLYGANLYGFVHRAFLEYFCAAAFVNRFERTKEIMLDQLKYDVYGAHWKDRNWHEVLRLVCSMIDEKFTGEIIDYLITDVAQPPPEEYDTQPPWNIALAVQCLSELKNLSTVADSAKQLLEAVCSLFDTYLQRRDAYDKFLRDQIAMATESISSDWPHRILLTDWLLRYQSFNSSWTYADAFGRFIGAIGTGLNEVHEIILKYATHDDGELRFLATYTLPHGWPDDPHTLRLLQDGVASDEQSYVRRAALNMIVEYYREDEQTLPLLRDWAVNAKYSDVRKAALGAIIEHYRGDKQIWPLLTEWAVNAQYDDVRSASLSAVVECYHADGGTLLPLLRDWAVNARYSDVRIASVQAIVEHYREDEQTLPLLRDWAVNVRYSDVRSASLSAVVEYYRTDGKTLRTLLRDWAVNARYSDVRVTVTNLMVTHYRGDEQTLPLLRDWAVNARYSDVRSASLSAVVEYYRADGGTLPLLQECAVRDEDIEVRKVILSAIVKYYRGEEQTLPLLRDWAVNAKYSDVRIAALKAIVQHYREDGGTLPLLQECAVRDEDIEVRKAAINTVIAQLGDEQRLELLREWAVNAKYVDVRRGALNLVIKYYRGDARILPLLCDWAVGAKYSDLRNASLGAIMAHYPKDEQILALLYDRATRDPEELVRRTAVRAIGKHYRGDEQALSLLRALITQSDTSSPDSQNWTGNIGQTVIEVLAQYWSTHPDTLPLLKERAANDPTPWLREKAKMLADEIEAKKVLHKRY